MKRHEVASLLDMCCSLLLPSLFDFRAHQHIGASWATQNLAQLIVMMSEAGRLGWWLGRKDESSKGP